MIAIAAMYVGANVIAPCFVQGMSVVNAAMVKAAFSTLTQRLVVSVAANGGNFDKAMTDFISINTVKAIAFSVTTAGINAQICESLKIKFTDSLGSVFKKVTIQTAAKITADGLVNGHFPRKLNELVTPFIADVFGEFTSNQIGKSY